MPMEIVRTVAELRAAVARLPRPVALVPTMGALHAGHLALVEAARPEARSVVASIFVNPLQFAATDDLSRYPRDEEGDLRALRGVGVDVVWLPSVEAMYPAGATTGIEVVGGPTEGFEGAVRPGHFRGVATVVGKLFHQVTPDLAMFGEKDWQQVEVVRRMVADLDWPLRVVAVPTVREADGLAMSSRNRFLEPARRETAAGLHRVLQEVARALADGREAGPALDMGGIALQAMGMTPDYLALVGPGMVPVDRAPGRLVAAVRAGAVRLLDNLAVGVV